MNNLEETVELMKSDKYEDRFRAEYWQLKIRLDKLRNFLYSNRKKGNHQLLNIQYDCMTDYLLVLRARAEKEGINL